MKLLAMPNMALLLERRGASEAADTVSGSVARGPAAGAELLLESSMTDDDSSQADVMQPRRLRRRHGADDVFPTHAFHRHHVC